MVKVLKKSVVDTSLPSDDLDGLVERIDENDDDVPYESINERKVLIQSYDYAVRTLMDMVAEGDLILDPDYQRQYRWSDGKASRFIESVALNIPVPVLYFAEESDGSFSVIDGQQRLTSLLRFIKPEELPALSREGNIGDLVLRDLKVCPDFNGKKYVELERSDRSAIAKRPIRCIVVLNESDSTLKFEVFERLNTGSASLTDQEVRNCIYRGQYNTMIKKMANNNKFQEMISLPDNLKNTMKDVELVLRFLAYAGLTERSKYSSNYTEYLNNHMEEYKDLNSKACLDAEDLFKKTIDLIYDSLGPGVAFRRPSDRANMGNKSYAHTLINGAIYESQMVAFSKVISSGRKLRNATLKSRMQKAFRDDEYWETLFQGTAKRHKALKRSDILGKLLLG